MSGLQRFEDEKRRIIESCFSKLAPDGTLQESYITHLRIIEDAAFPSSPAPPDSDPAQKKPRTIIIAVRSSGRVRVHKARENANKTFSVGKTWQIDELSAIQSYTALIPRTPEEEQQKRWAGQLGFTVTLGKPYYWQADSPQERLFFIGSLVKIYRKYTGGSVPKLIGFEERDVQKILGVPKPSAPPSNQGQQSSPLVQRPAQSSSPAQPPTLTSQPSNYSLPVNGSVGTGPHGRIPPPRIPTDRGEPPSRPSTGNSGQPNFRKPRPQVSTPSFTSGRPSTANSPLPRDDRGRGADPFTPGSGSRQPTPSSQRRAATDIPPDSSPPKRDEPPSLPPSLQPNLPPSLQSNLPPGLRAGSSSVASPASRFDRSGTPVSERAITPDTSTQSPRQQQTPADVPPVPSHSGFAPPERRRPPLNIEPQRANSRDPSNMVPAPLATPSSQPGFMRPTGPPARSADRPEAPQPLRVGGRPSTAANEDRVNHRGGDSPTFGATPAATAPTGRPEGLPAALTVQAPPPKVQEPPKEETPEEEPTMDKPPTPESPEETRPGLGPMVKKKSKAEVASAFRKIASAAAATNGFKPRAGGAAERLRLAAMKSESSDGPDGITGVVPAPSLLRRETDESSRPGTADPVAQRNASLDLSAKKSMDSQARAQVPNPEVTVTKAPEQRPESVGQASEASQMTVQQPQPKLPEKKKVDPPRPKQLSEEMKNELKSIDVDPRLLSGSEKAIEFVELLDDFGWRGEGVHTKSIEELNEDIERELNKAQIGGWFDKLDEEDERVEKLKGSLDSVIAECDELDGLLALYGVELGTLSDDIAYIEAQSQGLQVHAANQKLLQSEIKKFIEQKEFDKKQAEIQAELLRQRELQREASMRSTESPTSYGGESRDSLDERPSVDKGPLGSLRRREGLGSQSGDDEATKEKKKKIGAWKSVRKKFHAP